MYQPKLLSLLSLLLLLLFIIINNKFALCYSVLWKAPSLGPLADCLTQHSHCYAAFHAFMDSLFATPTSTAIGPSNLQQFCHFLKLSRPKLLILINLLNTEITQNFQSQQVLELFWKILEAMHLFLEAKLKQQKLKVKSNVKFVYFLNVPFTAIILKRK